MMFVLIQVHLFRFLSSFLTSSISQSLSLLFPSNFYSSFLGITLAIIYYYKTYTFTMASDSNPDSLPPHVLNEIQQRTEHFRSFQLKVHSKFTRVKTQYDAICTRISNLDNAWSSNLRRMTADEFVKEKVVLLDRKSQIMEYINTLNTGAVGMFDWANHGRMLRPSGAQFDDGAYIDYVLHNPQPPTTDMIQWKKYFCDTLVAQYDSSLGESGTYVWCPILGEYKHYRDMTAMPILNCQSVDKWSAEALFGATAGEEEHMWRPQNGVVVFKLLAEMLDAGEAAILPATGERNDKKCDFKMYLLDPGLRGPNAPAWTRGLHKKRLRYTSGFRPGKRYLYFKFLVNALRRRRAAVPSPYAITVVHDDNDDVEGQLLPVVSRALWLYFEAQPAVCRIQQAILYKFSMQFGCLSEPNTNRLWGVQQIPRLAVQEERHVSMHAMQWAVVCNRLAKEEDEKVEATLATTKAENDIEECWRYGEFEEAVDGEVNSVKADPAEPGKGDGYDSESDYERDDWNKSTENLGSNHRT